MTGSSEPDTGSWFRSCWHTSSRTRSHIYRRLFPAFVIGVLKAQWKPADYSDMLSHPFGFANDDIDLIYSGLERRAGRYRMNTDARNTLGMVAAR